ncbi:alpha/beta hydrolase [Enterococcus timonensis]|uniref:alpha/beta hydrolase n=1 Tax=Enterococcus timonensis TaxID=1852364 RepID=UPI0008D8E04D|nr:alpha/beta fold hydrolase [Enterococcus timonensis]
MQKPKEIYEYHSHTGVLLLHAYSGSSNDVRQLARKLGRENFTVYAPIFSGHGTDRPEDILNSGPENWEKEAQEALSFLKKAGCTKIFIFGLSMGGLFATRLLETRDMTVAGGGIFSSPIYPLKKNNVAESFIIYAGNLLKDDPEKDARLAEISQGVSRQLVEIENISLTAFENLSKITEPFFIGQAGLDEMIPAKDILQTVTTLTENNCELTFHWYAKSTHVLTVGPQRKVFESDVLSFIENN